MEIESLQSSVSAKQADLLAKALQESRSADAALLESLREKRQSRRMSWLLGVFAIVIVVAAIGLLLISVDGEEGVGGDSLIESAMIDQAIIVELEGRSLDSYIESIELSLRKPGDANQYLYLGAAYAKRFSMSGDERDKVSSYRAFEHARTLFNKKGIGGEVNTMRNPMMFGLLFLLLIIASVGIIIAMLQNGLAESDEQVDARWAQIEAVTQRRLDLIPQLVETVKGYATHEMDLLAKITEARASAVKALQETKKNSGRTEASIAEFSAASSQLGGALGKLMLVVENYPNLKANESFVGLQDQLEGTENRIAVERQRYNESVRGLNTKLRKFPHNFVGSMFRYEPRGYYESKIAADEPVKVTF